MGTASSSLQNVGGADSIKPPKETLPLRIYSKETQKKRKSKCNL